MRFNFDNCGFSRSELEEVTAKVLPYAEEVRKKLSKRTYDFPESFLLLPEDKEYVEKIKVLAKEKESPNLAGIVVIGIGGSNLGAMAFTKAIKAKREVLYLETVDPLAFSEVLNKLKEAYSEGKHYLLLFISQSGTTTETIANFGALIPEFKSLDKNFQDHVIVVTAQGSNLWQYAEDQVFAKISVPQVIVGRYSVFSSVGLFPLFLAGFDMEEILRGASRVDENTVLMSAAATFLNLQTGKTIHNLFIFSPALEGVGKWWRQLAAESLGKDGKGFTPIVSIGSTDLHSLGQLYFDGPQDKFTTFFGVKDFGADFEVRGEENLSSLAPNIEGKTLGEIMRAILAGVKASYAKKNMPHVEIDLERISEEEIATFLQFKMLETIYLAKLLGVNAFDQPAVEDYKEETRRILSGS
ncbi:MAG: hypothetical protein HYW80_01300 [Parcubacteria group bacterium]|nr:hypothetical protein [Parcubacteria group bacterium]